MLYRCEFNLNGNRLAVYSSEGIQAFKDGFWIDMEMELTYGEDAKFWVPPGQIIYITKDSMLPKEDPNGMVN